MTFPINVPAIDTELPRPKDVGVLAMEVYFPRRVCSLFINYKRVLTHVILSVRVRG
jgi:hypothetical protein